MKAMKITYTDFNGVERTETHYFNLSRSELIKMQSGTKGGYKEMLERAIDAQDEQELSKIFEDLIDKSYGIKTPDGRGFRKSPEILAEFKATGAYDELFIQLLDADKAAEFFNGVIPANLAEMVEAEMAKQQATDTN